MTSEYCNRVALAIAGLLASVPEVSRGHVLSIARREAPSTGLPDPSVYLIPSNATGAKANQHIAMNGSLVQALLLAKGTDQVTGIRKAVSDTIAGTVAAGDPASSSLSMPLLEAIAQANASGFLGFQDQMTPQVATALKAATDEAKMAYDCFDHQQPLGGSGFTDFIEKLGQSFQGIGKAFGTTDTTATVETGETGKDPKVTPPTTVKLETTIAESEADLGVNITEMMKSVEDFKNKAIVQQDQALAAARRSAKLTWAGAMLKASDEAAEMLLRVSPDFTSTKSTINTGMDILTAAKSSGEISQLSAVGTALKSALGNSYAKSELSTLVSGDL